MLKAGAFCRSSLELLSEVDTRPKERKCLHFLTLGSGPPPPPSPGGPQPQPRRPARSGRGREGTMSGERGMCPQRLFTNTKLFMIAGKRNPTRARSSGWSPGRRDSGKQALSLTRSERGSRAPRARRGRVGAQGSGYGRAAFVFQAPRGSGLRGAGAWRDPAPQALSPATLCALLPSPSSSHSSFLPPSRLRENSQYQRKRNSLRELRFSDKNLSQPATRRVKPATDFNFLPLNTYFLA